MRTFRISLALCAMLVTPAQALSPHQVFLMLAAFEVWQQDCATTGEAFSQWNAAALRRAAKRHGVDPEAEDSARRLALYARRIREGVEPGGQAQWCAAIRANLEGVLRGLGDT